MVPQSPVVRATINTNVTISFTIEDAKPPVVPADINWSFTPKEGRPARNFEEFLQSNTSTMSYSQDRRSLTLFRVDLLDAGSYMLRASNQAGERTGSLELEVESE